jgi:hypothetical protein
MNEQAWIDFWQVVLTIGLGSYALLALVIVPCGARDIYRLFQTLDRSDIEKDESEI